MTTGKVMTEDDLVAKFSELVDEYKRGNHSIVAVECFRLIEEQGYDQIADLWYLRGLAVYNMHKFVGAVTCFEQAINLLDNNIDYYISLAGAYSTLLQDKEAAACYEKAITLSDSEEERSLLSKKCLHHLSESEKAVPTFPYSEQEFFEELTFQESDKLLEAFEDNKSFQELAETYSEMLSREISPNAVRNTILISYIEEGNGDVCYRLTKEYLKESDDSYLHNILIRCLCKAIPNAEEEIFNECKSWGEKWARPIKSAVEKYKFDRPIQSKEDIHVGFCCDFMGSNYGAIAMIPMAKCLAKNGLKVTFYNLERSRYESDCENFYVKNVWGKSIDEIHEMIVNDRVTILIDTNGRYRDKHTYGLVIKRSAPIQIAYMNAVCTSGVENFDFMMGHYSGIPEEKEGMFTESIIRLPCNVTTAYHFERDMPLAEAPCLKVGYITFGCFTSAFKLNEMLIDIWAQILSKVPQSKLVLKCRQLIKPRVEKRIVNMFEERGVKRDRLLLEGFSWVPFMRERLNEIDICLDTYPQSAGSTNQHSIWQGVPVVTLRTGDFRSAITSSLLDNLGRQDLIAHSVEEYINIAVKLGLSFNEVNTVRSEIAGSLDNCPDYNPELVYGQLADKFFEICSRLQQDSIRVSSSEALEYSE
ncbi:MAG: hypothetical protein MI867_06345 [Pseudomonadales bacterium]|nr:hypothetical protein [Pseudomonadales bacterium]